MLYNDTYNVKFPTINIGLQDIHPNINSLISGNFSNSYRDVWQDATAGQDETDDVGSIS